MQRKAKKINHRIIVLGDIHATDEINYYPDVEFNGKLINARLYYLHKIIKTIIKEYVIKGQTSFIQTGDWFDKKKVSPDTKAIVADIIYHLTEVGNVYTVRGNHDYYGDVYDHLDGFKVKRFHKLEQRILPHLSFRTDIGDKISIFGLNHRKKMEEIYAKIAHAKKLKPTFLVMHQEINGMCFDNDYKIKDGVNPEKLKKFNLVINGHLHMPQLIHPYNIIVPGVLLPKTFGECFEPNFVYIDFCGEKKIAQHIRIPTFCDVPLFHQLYCSSRDLGFKSYQNQILSWHGFARLNVEIQDDFDINGFKEHILKRNKKLYHLDINVAGQVQEKLSLYKGQNIRTVIERHADENCDKAGIEKEGLIKCANTLIE